MGRVLHTFTRLRKKQRPKKFELNHVPLCTPQSTLDKKIFYPNWKTLEDQARMETPSRSRLCREFLLDIHEPRRPRSLP